MITKIVISIASSDSLINDFGSLHCRVFASLIRPFGASHGSWPFSQRHAYVCCMSGSACYSAFVAFAWFLADVVEWLIQRALRMVDLTSSQMGTDMGTGGYGHGGSDI